MTSTTVAITTGTLTAKIQRHEAASNQLTADQRPDHGRDRGPRRPRADRGAALVRWEREHDHGQRGRDDQRAEHSLQDARRDEHADRRRQRARERHDTEADQAEREDAALAVDVAERSADQDQRREREHVAVGDPLLPGEPAAEVGGDRRQRDVDRRRVQHGDERAHDRGQQRQPLRPGHCKSGDGGIRVLPVTSGISIATSSSKHQDHSSPGSSERMIGWPLAFA